VSVAAIRRALPRRAFHRPPSDESLDRVAALVAERREVTPDDVAEVAGVDSAMGLAMLDVLARDVGSLVLDVFHDGCARRAQRRAWGHGAFSGDVVRCEVCDQTFALKTAKFAMAFVLRPDVR
jgi:hypothetical protein